MRIEVKLKSGESGVVQTVESPDIPTAIEYVMAANKYERQHLSEVYAKAVA